MLGFRLATPASIATKRPPCPKCGAMMMLARIEPPSRREQPAGAARRVVRGGSAAPAGRRRSLAREAGLWRRDGLLVSRN
jgi:hypothetical protein